MYVHRACRQRSGLVLSWRLSCRSQGQSQLCQRCRSSWLERSYRPPAVLTTLAHSSIRSSAIQNYRFPIPRCGTTKTITPTARSSAATLRRVRSSRLTIVCVAAYLEIPPMSSDTKKLQASTDLRHRPQATLLQRTRRCILPERTISATRSLTMTGRKAERCSPKKGDTTVG